MPCEHWTFGPNGPTYSDDFVLAFPYVALSPVVKFNGSVIVDSAPSG